MEVGLVKWFNNSKGWGFISRSDGSDVFVHYSQVHGDGYRTLRQGDEVEFQLRSGPRGQFAEDVRTHGMEQSPDVDAQPRPQPRAE